LFSFKREATYLLGTSSGILQSTDNWSKLEKIKTGPIYKLSDIVINNNYIFAGMNGGGIYRSSV
jgi:hypothetical protein